MAFADYSQMLVFKHIREELQLLNSNFAKLLQILEQK